MVSYKKDPDSGKTIKVTQKIKTVKVLERVDAAVAERKNWKKFGQPQGKETSQTSFAEEVKFSLSAKTIEQQQPKPSEQEASNVVKSNVKCRTCGGDHFTSRCPLKGMLSASSVPDAAGGAPDATDSTAKSGYVPPHLRNKAAGGSVSSSSRASDNDRDDVTLRVTNLGEDVIEDDLRAIFGKYGNTARVNILRDRETGKSRGFGFVVFNTHSDAEKAARDLDGKPLENLIMKVEFANKRT